MALGTNSRNYHSGNQGNNQNQMFEPSYYSRLRIKNPEQNLALSFTFWKGTLKIAINETGTNVQDGRSNNTELAYIHLSPTKAMILAEGVSRIINDDSNAVYGIDTGSGETRGFIAVGREMGNPYIFIAKVNPNGDYESSQRFNFNVDYNYILKIHDITNLKCQKEFMNNVELVQFMNLLKDYSRCASGALGASVHDIGRYEAAKTSNLIRKIAEKSGADSKYGNGGNGFNFDNSAEYSDPTPHSSTTTSSTVSRYTSIDDLESELG